MATHAQRVHLLHLMEFLLVHEKQIHYAQVRPMRAVHLSEAQMTALMVYNQSITMDCSEAVTCLCRWAGLHDPNGRGYSGEGNTGTLGDFLPHYTNPGSALVGALVKFGPGYGEHVAMVMVPGPDPILWSHGSERGPLKVPLSVERQFHNPPYTFLSIAHL